MVSAVSGSTKVPCRVTIVLRTARRSEPALATGTWLTLLTTMLMSSWAEPPLPSDTVKVTGYEPLCVNDGVHEKTRVAGVNEAPLGTGEALKARVSASASAPATVKVSGLPSLTALLPTAFRVGARLTRVAVELGVA